MVLGEVIKQARQKMFLTQDEFASELKVSFAKKMGSRMNLLKNNGLATRRRKMSE